ncbi:MAG: hypothetical protein HYU53_01160 [Acidobacteria bacterium]|nr:hypothetical protein [Acidobacteriota bacterium]
MRTNGLIAVLCFFLAATLAAQAGVDLSGTWKLQRSISEPSTASADVVLVITQTAEQLVVERRVGDQRLTSTIFLDGRPSTSEAAAGLLQTTRARWEGACFVVEGSRTLRDGGTAAVKEVFELTANREGLTIERTIHTGTTEFKSREVFARTPRSEI